MCYETYLTKHVVWSDYLVRIHLVIGTMAFVLLYIIGLGSEALDRDFANFSAFGYMAIRE